MRTGKFGQGRIENDVHAGSGLHRERSFNPTLLIAGRDAQDAW